MVIGLQELLLWVVFCIVGLVYLGLKHLVDRYNIFFAYNPSKINKHIHGSAVNFVLWAVIMLQINITFFTGLRAGTCATNVFVIMLLIVILGVWVVSGSSH